MKTIKMLFLLTGLSISSIGFGMEDSNANNRVAKELSLDSKTELDKSLIQAIKNSNSELVIYLLNRGADKDCEDKNSHWNESALFLAVKDSRTQCDGANQGETIVRILLDQGASVNKTIGPYNWTALHRAAYIGRPNAVRLLLEKGANFNLSIKGFDDRTPLKLAQIYATLANGGYEVVPHVTLDFKEVNQNKPKKKLFSDEVSKTVLEWMETVVENGTGIGTKIDGYRIGGKTGTSQKAINGIYTTKKVCSFVAALPINNPKYLVLVVIDEPSKAYAYGSTVAVPVAKEIIESLIVLEEIPPISKENKIIVKKPQKIEFIE